MDPDPTDAKLEPKDLAAEAHSGDSEPIPGDFMQPNSLEMEIPLAVIVPDTDATATGRFVFDSRPDASGRSAPSTEGSFENRSASENSVALPIEQVDFPPPPVLIFAVISIAMLL